jgi:hypothetical protein
MCTKATATSAASCATRKVRKVGRGSGRSLPASRKARQIAVTLRAVSRRWRISRRVGQIRFSCPEKATRAEPSGIVLKRAKAACDQRRLVPASAAVPAAAKHQKDNNNDEKRGIIHVVTPIAASR